MNKQELIKKYNNECFATISTDEVLEDLQQLDEPQQVQVPQFVADWIEECKLKKDLSLGGAIQLPCPEVYEWLMDWGNQETFARAWLDGYEVEKEKRYLVKMKSIGDHNNYLKYNTNQKNWYFGSRFIYVNDVDTKIHYTRKELEEANFGWVFDCEGVEVEEVEG